MGPAGIRDHVEGLSDLARESAALEVELFSCPTTFGNPHADYVTGLLTVAGNQRERAIVVFVELHEWTPERVADRLKITARQVRETLQGLDRRVQLARGRAQRLAAIDVSTQKATRGAGRAKAGARFEGRSNGK